MNKAQLLNIVEQYCRTGVSGTDQISVVRIPDQKTVFIEKHDNGGRSVYLSEHQVDGQIYWAGYSSLSETVYISGAG
jgi:hypothetical protein